jgi:hypothetical protein
MRWERGGNLVQQGEAGRMFVIDEEFNIWAKTEDLVPQWNNRHLDPRVKKITIVVATLLREHGLPCVITSIRRDDGGVHALGRAVDVRSQNLEAGAAELIRQKVNRWFVYGLKGDGRPGETIPPLDHAGNASKSTAPHFHIQVPAIRGRA